MTCHRLVLVLGLTLPISAGTAHARQSNVSRDDRITPERLGLPKGNTRTSEPFVIRIYKTDDGGQILKPQPSGYPFTITSDYTLKENEKPRVPEGVDLSSRPAPGQQPKPLDFRAGVHGVVVRAGGGPWGTIAVQLADGSIIQYLHTTASHVIATDEQDLVGEILGLTGGKGARVVFDPVGGPTFAKLARATARLGILFLYGALSPEPTPLPLVDVLGKWITIRGYVLMEITSDPARLERGKRFVNEGLAEGSLKPIVARTFPLEEIVEAHRYLESNQQIGKIIVTV
ncbi:MAG: zinc-binding dehydrogenase [Planctomycetaceae bacterium]